MGTKGQPEGAERNAMVKQGKKDYKEMSGLPVCLDESFVSERDQTRSQIFSTYMLLDFTFFASSVFKGIFLLFLWFGCCVHLFQIEV